MRQKVLAGLLTLVWVVFGGCSYIGLDTQATISPPKANADQQEIHQLLQGDNAELTFIYPKSGDYRSAIIMKDFTGDGQEDAIGFTWMETGAKVQFLVKEDVSWELLASFENNATQVDRVCFGDLNGNGQLDILIGWGNTQSVAATLGVYSYDDGKMKEILFDSKYEDMILTDFNGNGVQEIFLIQKAIVAQDETTESMSANAEVFTLEDGKVTRISKTESDNSVTKFTNIMFGKLSNKMVGVVVDGARADGSMVTQVFYLDDMQHLHSVPEKPNDPETVNLFSRLSGSAFTATDINKDGIIELPMARKLPALPEDTTLDSTSFSVQWCGLSLKNSTGYISVMSTFMNTAEGYWFRTPNWLRHEITAINDTTTRTLTYYAVKTTKNDEGEEVQLLGARLFSIRVFNQTGWEEWGKPSRYEILRESNEQIYVLITYKQDSKYTLAMEKVRESFSLLSDLQ